jgi:hypothetical protein
MAEITAKLKIKAEIEAHLDELFDEMSVVVAKYWNTVLKLEKEHPGPETRSILRVRCSKKENSIRADWYYVNWIGKGKDGKPYEKMGNITKPANSFAYTMSKLHKHAREWEKEIVEETELQLAEYREEVRHVVKMLISLRHATDHEKKRLAGSVK